MITLLHRLASLRLTLVGLVALAAALVADQNGWLSGAWAITPPLAGLSLNLAASLLVDRRFRRRPALFGFHLCLLMLAALAGYSLLARYEARLPLVEGQAFDNDLVDPVHTGPIVPVAIRDGAFRQGSIEVDYSPKQRRGATRSQVRVEGRGWVEVGDDVPLIIDGYRIYTTSNKGFAALLTWLPERGDALLGAVQFPSYPASELGQVAHWTTPRGQVLQLGLGLDPSVYAQSWTLSSAHAGNAFITLEVDGERQTLMPGDVAVLSGGRLRFERVGMWMGYEVTHDPALPWLFGLAVLAVAFLSVHFAGRVMKPVDAHALGGRENIA